MTLHGIALWSHVVLAVVLVGGSTWSHVASTRLRRSRTVDEARAHAATVHGFVRASGPVALGVLVAGGYLATVGSYWTSPWLVTSLALFATVGALYGAAVQPASTALVAALGAAPSGPLPREVDRLVHAPALAAVPAVGGGLDLAIVFLMTNKPGLALSVVAAGLGLSVGLVLAVRETRPAPAVAR